MTMKRIQSITITRETDTDSDTSWLGEYSDKKTSEFSIDRAHDLDCQLNTGANDSTIEQLERVIAYLEQERRHASDLYDHYGTLDASARYDSANDAQDTLIEKQDELAECSCERGEWHHREYRYFNPSSNYVDAFGHALPGNTAEDVRKYTLQDYERLESLYAGQWEFIGVRAEAIITVDGVRQEISSGGLWGIESNSEESYIQCEEQEQLSELRRILYDLGFNKRAIAEAVKAM